MGTAATDGDNTVITYVIPADGSYDLRIDGLYMSNQAAPAISATLTRAEPGAALTGQTAPKLTAPTAENYLCQVSWPDGTVIKSDVVAYTPPTPTAGRRRGRPATPTTGTSVPLRAATLQIMRTWTTSSRRKQATAPTAMTTTRTPIATPAAMCGKFRPTAFSAR